MDNSKELELINMVQKVQAEWCKYKKEKFLYGNSSTQKQIAKNHARKTIATNRKNRSIMTRADYTHSLEYHAGREVIVIEDLNLGNTSVTNDIENVIDDIGKMENINVNHYMVVYKDSEGMWDGWDFGKFIPLGADTWKEAVITYISKQINSVNS